jgi:protein SCO1
MKQAFAILVLICAFLAGGCQSKPAKHYPIEAMVISADPGKKLIIVKHGDIPGLMPGMTMTYEVADPHQIEKLQPGDKISADLVVSENIGRLEKIQLLSKGDRKLAPGTTQRIPEKGDDVPDFALVNQDGKLLHFHDFRGKTLLVTFIYTRCPLPDFCPRMNENFRAVQKLLESTPDATQRVAFLSISFDPNNDTPAVLKHYGSVYRKSAPGEPAFPWQFAAPAEKDLPNVAQFFGLVYQLDGAQIVHSLSTTLIGPDGKVVEWYSGNDWNPSDAAQAIASLLQRS